MKVSKFSEQQIALLLKQVDDGLSVEEVCRKTGISQQTYYRWRQKYGGLMPSEVRRLRQLEEENRRLQQMVADLSLDKAMLQDVLQKSSEACDGAAAGGWSARRVPGLDGPVTCCSSRNPPPSTARADCRRLL
jgi:putative transposase